MSVNKRRCLVLEDHVQAQQWLSRAVEQAFNVSPTVCATIADAKSYLLENTPDIALIDLGLPDGNGVEIIQGLAEIQRRESRQIMIVVSTVMHDDESIFNALREGATGYILKDESQSDLVSMLQGINAGKPPLSPQIATRLLHFFREDDEAEQLSPRQTEMLQLLAKGYTVPKVGELLGIKKSTAQSYVKEIYRKLNINSRAEATHAAVRRGLV